MLEEHLRHLLFAFAWIEIGEWQPNEQDSSNDVSGSAKDQIVHCLTHRQVPPPNIAMENVPMFAIECSNPR